MLKVVEDTGQRCAEGAAPIRNMTLLDGLIRRLASSSEHLPHMGVLSGPSGFGKSFAAAHAAVKYGACYVQVRSTWTAKHFMEEVLKQQGQVTVGAKRVAQMIDIAAEHLALSRRPLIIDECDHVLARGLIEVIRDLHELAATPIVLIGEEQLPQKLVHLERVHGRIQDWEQALPCNLQDARALARFYAADVEIKDELLELLVARTWGSARRISINLERVAGIGRKSGHAVPIGLAEWGDREIHTGEPPLARRLGKVF